jgi:large subunit ribosomal protein L13
MASATGTDTSAALRHEWFVVDASGQVLGRLASRIARILTGKHRPGYIPYLDTGDFVVVTNAEKVRMTGNKLDEKVYRRHTGYPGRLIEDAVRGMLPKSRLGRKQIKKLKVYRGPKHPHEAQQPRPLKISAAGGK